MNFLITILLLLAGLIILLLVIAIFIKKEYFLEEQIIINGSTQKVFEYVKHIKNQDYYNKWVMTDPGMKKGFKGKDGTVGFIYYWDGNKKAGQGAQEITEIVEGERVGMEIRFIRPFAGVSDFHIVTAPVSGNQTRVNWTFGSKLKYPMNIMILFTRRMLQTDMKTSLLNLKRILES